MEQQAESIVQENEGEKMMDRCQQEHEGKNPDENEEIFAQESEEKERKEEGESTPRASGETEPAEQGVSVTLGSEQENECEGEGSLAQNNDD